MLVKRSMKIVLTVHKFFPDSSAGTEILTLGTAQELKRRGHEVVVWTALPSDKPKGIDSYVHEGIKVMRYYSNNAISIRRTASLDSAQEVANLSGRQSIMEMEYRNREFEGCFSMFLSSYRPDIVHAFHLARLSATTIHAAVAQKVPMLFTATDFWCVCPTSQLTRFDGFLCKGPDRYSINCIRHLVTLTQSTAAASILSLAPDRLLALLLTGAGKSWWPERKYSALVVAAAKRMEYMRDAMNRLERVLVSTKLMANILVQHGLDPKRVVYQTFGISMPHMKSIPIRKRGTTLRIGYIGTLYEHKGVHILLDAIRHLPQGAAVEVWIYGNERDFPAYAARLRKMAGSDPRILFCGTFQNENISQIFSELDVLVVPSLWYENTPLVIYSAQASKTPVIASNLGGMTEVIEHEKNGLLFDKGNAVDLAQQVIRLLGDRTLLERLSANAHLPKSIPAYVDELESMYMCIVSERLGKP